MAENGPLDHYAVLGVIPGATADTIRRAFRSRALATHPDHNPHDPDAERQFRLVAAAYEVLGDPAARRAYDERLGLRRPRAPNGRAASRPASSGPRDREATFESAWWRLVEELLGAPPPKPARSRGGAPARGAASIKAQRAAFRRYYQTAGVFSALADLSARRGVGRVSARDVRAWFRGQHDSALSERQVWAAFARWDAAPQEWRRQAVELVRNS